MAGIYAILALIGGIAAAASTAYYDPKQAIVTIFLVANLLPLLTAFLLATAITPAPVRPKR